MITKYLLWFIAFFLNMENIYIIYYSYLYIEDKYKYVYEYRNKH